MRTRDDPNFDKDFNWATDVMQPIAIAKIYRTVWPGASIESADKEGPGSIGQFMDFAGCDKLIRVRGGKGYAFGLAQRFRRWDDRRYQDFTIRVLEWHKNSKAWHEGAIAPGFYAYGIANEDETDFHQMWIIAFRKFVEWALGNPLPRVQMNPGQSHERGFYPWPFALMPTDLVFHYYGSLPSSPPTFALPMPSFTPTQGILF